MTREEKIRLQKSIMYKIISLGCSVYVDEWDEYVISLLVCQNCNSVWNKSRTECFYCGTENYHIFRCVKCDALYSITNASQKCSEDNCGGKLIKACINKECISNRNKRLATYLEKLGGVFEIGKSGSTLNEMRCKSCGHKTSKFLSMKAVVVDGNDFGPDTELRNVLYLIRTDVNRFNAKFNDELMTNEGMREILAKVFEINSDGLVEIEE